jgi:hypothetical protein
VFAHTVAGTATIFSSPACPAFLGGVSRRVRFKSRLSIFFSWLAAAGTATYLAAGFTGGLSLREVPFRDDAAIPCVIPDLIGNPFSNFKSRLSIFFSCLAVVGTATYLAAGFTGGLSLREVPFRDDTAIPCVIPDLIGNPFSNLNFRLSIFFSVFSRCRYGDVFSRRFYRRFVIARSPVSGRRGNLIFQISIFDFLFSFSCLAVVGTTT